VSDSAGLPRSDLYVVYSISNSPYQRWQADLLDFSIRDAEQPGVVVRLCSHDADHPELAAEPSDSGYTFMTLSFAEVGNTRYHALVRWMKKKLKIDVYGRYHFFCLNKPFGMKAFLDAHPDLDPGVRLMWLDPDMVFHRPWNPPDNAVGQGRVVGQHWWGYDPRWLEGSGGGRDGISMPPPEEAMMFPFCLTVSDMRRIIDLFCRLSTDFYRATRDWKSEMYGLVASMATFGLTCRTVAALGTCNNWPRGLADDPVAPISHYTQPMIDGAGNEIWDKRRYTPHTLSQPWDRPPAADRASTLTDRRTLQTLHRFIDLQEKSAGSDPSAPVPP
jgi:hypothetical protein